MKPLDLPNEISNLAIDSLGFIWMSSEANLYRFNGSELELRISLDGEKIVSLFNKKGIHYMGTADGRILAVNPYNSKNKVIYESQYKHPITDFYVIDDQNFIALSYGSGVQISLNGKISQINIDNGLLSNEVYEVVEFKGDIYISSDQGINIIKLIDNDYKISKIEKKDGLADLVVTQLLTTNDKLWYSDYDTHIGSIDTNGNIINYPVKNKGRIKNIINHQGVIYVLNDAGIQSLEDENWILKYDSKISESGKLFQLDEEDNLWLIDTKNQLSVGNLRFQKINLDIDEIRAITKIGDRFYLGNESGLYVYSNDIQKKINSKNITYLTRFREYLLVGTFSRGVMVYDKNDQLIDQIESWSNIQNESILSIYKFKENIYISSLSGVVKMGLFKGKLRPIKSLNSIVGQTYIYCIFGDEQYMYFGSDRNGLIKWNNATDKIEKIERFDNGNKIGSVYSITSDENGNIWFTSTERGIGKISAKGVEYIEHIGILKDEFTSITNLNDGALLLIRSSSLGLLQHEDNHFMYFDQEIGLKEETAFLNTTTQDTLNTYFINDKSIYKYSSFGGMKIHPEVIIDEVIVNLTTIDNRNIFEEDENNISIKYKGSWLSDPAKLSYQYKLEGFADIWRDTKDDQVAFPKLAPGQYNFRIRAAENGIFSNEPESNFSFKIKRYFYNLWYVRLLIAGLVITLLLTWWKFSENQKKEKLILEKTIVDNQLINLKSQLNPHFLFNAFNTLIALIKEDSDRSIAFVEKMTLFYRNMLESGENSLVNLDIEKNMLEQYVGILKERFNSQLLFNFEYDEPNKYQIPPMTLQLLVENAVKHNVVSSKNPLQIKITQTKDVLTVWNKRNDLINSSVGTQTGLSNIFKRFELVNLDAPIIKSNEEYFEVTLKLRKL